jgi:hypothetical protein
MALLVLAVLLFGCSEDPETLRECACDQQFTGAEYYYTYYTEEALEVCADGPEAQRVVDDLAADCVRELESEGFVGVVCDCYCDATGREC